MNEKQMHDEIAASLKQARLDVDNFEALCDNAGWLRLAEIASAQLANRTQALLASPEVLLQSEMRSSDFEKGCIQGIRLFMQLPSLATEAAKATLQKHEVVQDEDQSDETN